MRLFEFGDLDCVPDLYHVYLRKYLVFFYKAFGYYNLWVPGFTNFVKKLKKKELMECCSGAGEPLQLIDARLDTNQVGSLSYLLSDIRPNPEIVDKFNQEGLRFRYVSDSVDVTQDLEKFDCPKIFINSFHHFTNEQVEKIFLNNFKRKNEIIILEYVSKSFLGFFSMLVGPIVVIFTLPFVVKLRHLPVMMVFTYILPLFPLMMLWDGIISCLHEYSESNLKAIVKKLGYDLDVNVDVDFKRSVFYPAGVSVIAFTFSERD